MADDFINEFRSSFGDDEGPDWIQDLTDEDEGAGPQDEGNDEFDRLRQQSARASSTYDDLTYEEESSGSGGGFSLNQFTPGQRLVLALLVLLNVIVGGVALLAVTGVIG